MSKHKKRKILIYLLAFILIEVILYYSILTLKQNIYIGHSVTLLLLFYVFIYKFKFFKKIFKKMLESIKTFFIRQFFNFILKAVIPSAYFFFSLRSVDENLTVFITYQYEGMHPNIEALQKEIIKVYPSMKFKYHLYNIDKFTRMQRVKYTFKFIKDLGRAKYCVTTHSVAATSAIRMRKETIYIQLWHACGAFKKWGYAAMESKGWQVRSRTNKSIPYRNVTYAVASSAEIIPQYAQAFNMPEDRILPYGVPRTDKFFSSEYVSNSKSYLKNLFPPSADKKVILFAPTFRGNNLKTAKYAIDLDLDELYNNLQDKYVFVFKMHPAVRTPKLDEKYSDFAYVCDSSVDINDLFGAADIVISDYSSLIFEYSLLERPMIFFAPDYEKYASGRGFFYDYKEFIPGPLVFDTENLIKVIKEDNFDLEKVKKFKEKFMSACNGHACETIVKKLFK